MSLFIYCPKCEARFDVTDCGDASRFLCDECGTEVSVRFANLILMPGGIATEIKELADGSRWLVCPKCGRNANISGISSGNRFRCRRCSMLLQVPPQNAMKPIPPARSADEVIKCPGCRTRYDTSKYTPGNRFRCRRCGMPLSVPPRAAWKKTGEWEIDVSKSLIRCNRCNQAYPLGSMKKGDVFVCRKCRKVFSGLGAEQPVEARKVSEEEWEIDLEAGFITCPGCKYSYDLSSLPQDADFPCKHCDRVFRMPRELPKEAGSETREKIACQKCGAEYDVSGYLRGTMFSCSNCEEILYIGLSGGYSPAPEEPGDKPEVSGRASKTRSFAPEPLGVLNQDAPAGGQIPAAATASATADESLQAAGALPPAVGPEAPPAAESTTPGGFDAVPTAPETPAPAEPAPEPPQEQQKPQAAARTEPLPMPGAAHEPAKPRPPSAKLRKNAQPSADTPRKVPVPFPPLPPEEVMARAKKSAPEPAPEQEPAPAPAAPENPAPTAASSDSKTVVRLIVRCTVCGTRHDAGGMSEGDRITCKCGKKIKIKGGKKPAAKAEQDPVEDALNKRGVKSGDVEVIDRE